MYFLPQSMPYQKDIFCISNRCLIIGANLVWKGYQINDGDNVCLHLGQLIFVFFSLVSFAPGDCFLFFRSSFNYYFLVTDDIMYYRPFLCSLLFSTQKCVYFCVNRIMSRAGVHFMKTPKKVCCQKSNITPTFKVRARLVS